MFYDPLTSCDFRPYMLQSAHNDEVAAFINKEVIQYITE